jgi:hypothetical protein
MMRRDAAIVNEMEFRMSLASKGLSPRSRGATMQRFWVNEVRVGATAASLMSTLQSNDHCLPCRPMCEQIPCPHALQFSQLFRTPR